MEVNWDAILDAPLVSKPTRVAKVLDAIAGLSSDDGGVIDAPSTACDRGFAYLRAALRESDGTEVLRTKRALRLFLRWSGRWEATGGALGGGEALCCLNNALFRNRVAQRAMVADRGLVVALASLLGDGAAGADAEATARVCRNLLGLFGVDDARAALGQLLYIECALVDRLLPRLEAGVALLCSAEVGVLEPWPSAEVHRLFIDALQLLNAVAYDLERASPPAEDRADPAAAGVDSAAAAAAADADAPSSIFNEDGADDPDSAMSRLGRLVLALLLHPRPEEGSPAQLLHHEVHLGVATLLMHMPPRFAHFLVAHGAVGALLTMLRAQVADASRAAAEHEAAGRLASTRERLRVAMDGLACAGTACTIVSRESLAARRTIKAVVFPTDAAAERVAAGGGDAMFSRDAPAGTLRADLIALMNGATFSSSRRVVAELLYVLCDENHHEMVARTGVGAAAGLLAAKGLFQGGRLAR